MDSLGSSRFPEYQAVIIVDYDDGRLFPLTDGCPKCLLPIANRKLLAYQLDLLSKSGALEIYIAAPKEYQTQLSQFLSEYGNSDNASVEFIWVDDMVGSADGLRAVNERIRGDFICMSSDMLCQYSFGELADLHRLRSSDLTMLLVSAPSEEAEKKGAPKKILIDEEDQEYIGICEDGRVMMKTPVLEIDESLKVLKPLLHKCTSSLTVRNDLEDMGVYIMSRWVLTFLMANKKISNLRTELVPFIVQRQFQSEEYLKEVIPCLKEKTGEIRIRDSLELGDGCGTSC
jgi:translation initiation factor eIF-2B subunit gamma